MDYRNDAFFGDLYAQHITSLGTVDNAWPANGLPVSVVPGYQVNQRIEPDGSGGAIVIWQSGQPGTFDIFAQRIRSSGVLDPAWPPTGRAVCTATGDQQLPRTLTDGAGGVFVFWQDRRGSNNDIYGHHVLNSGSLDAAWTTNGKGICVTAGDQTYPRPTSDGAGGLIVSWDDSRGTDQDVYAQHVLATGALDASWPVAGRRVCGALGQQFGSWPVPDGSGGAIVVWDDRRAGSNNTDLYAQRVLASGVVDPSWPTDGRALCTAAGDQFSDRPIPDGSGGALICWEDRRSGTSYDIYAQHILTSGQIAGSWPANGLAVCSATNDQRSPYAISDGAGGLIVAWTDYRGGASSDIYALRVSGAGVIDPSMPTNGRAVSTAVNDQTQIWSVSDNSGGAIITWQDTRSSASGDVYAQTVERDSDRDGLPDSWEVLGIPVAGGSPYTLPGANPNHKDVYVEVDAQPGWPPAIADLARVVSSFDQSPVSNPDGTTGIHLHIVGAGCDPCVSDANLPAGVWPNPPWPQIHSLKTSWFGTAAERASPNWDNIARARALAFRYCVFGDNFSTGYSGVCEGEGDDFIVTLGPIGGVDSDKRAGTFMHELGHSLGLQHGGNDDNRAKPNYVSVMNYTWQWPAAAPGRGRDMQNYRNSWRLDFSRTNLNALNEAGLDELSGIGGDPARVVPVGPPRHGVIRDWVMLVPLGGPVDWNGDGTANDVGVQRDISFLGAPITPNPSPGQTLSPYDDWSNLSFTPSEAFGAAAAAVPAAIATEDIDEMTQAVYDSISSLRFDCNDNSVDDGEEIENGTVDDLNANGIPDPCEAPAIIVAVGEPSGRSRALTVIPVAAGGAHEIRFVLQRPGQATLRVRDVAGRTIVTLVDGVIAEGRHTVRWGHVDSSGREITSGLYFVDLRSGDARAHGKILVLH
ncbi:MAG TPA: hypothetical protein VJY35_00970 [Candidatus Eisenbacteria bacterium]|nr:hypothetical protein [Candidatus Eisenbacteria bacterium]